MSTQSEGEATRHGHHGKTSQGLVDTTVVINALAIRPGEVLLDAGCGNGYMTRIFAGLTGPTGLVYALDPDGAAIERLAADIRDAPVRPLVGDITKATPIPAASLDLIYLSMVLHGFFAQEMAGFVGQVCSLLKTNGRLAVVEFKKEKTPFGPPMAIRFSPEELSERIGLPSAGVLEVGPWAYLQLFNREAGKCSPVCGAGI